MNRLQKKCLVASAGFHLLLLAILFVGPAFVSSGKRDDNRALNDFVAYKTIDELLAGGGSPKAAPPAPLPTPTPPQPKIETPQPAPPPKPEKVEQAKAEPPKVETHDPDAVSLKPTKKLPNVSLKPMVRPKNSNSTPKKTNDLTDEADSAREQQQRFAKAARDAARNLSQGLSSATTIELQGSGGGGVPYANFLDEVKRVYSDAWIVPDGVTDDEATATASVTIARDGTVVSSRIVKRSGNALADQSVEMTLRRVTYVAPLPESAKENQRTVSIVFNVKAKRATG